MMKKSLNIFYYICLSTDIKEMNQDEKKVISIISDSRNSVYKIFHLKVSIVFFSILFFSVQLLAQNGPAGVGTNTASVNQNRFWLKADVGVFSDAGVTAAVLGSRVQQWNDQSGVANNAVQATLAQRPIYQTAAVNGLPALRFLGDRWVTAGALPGIANNVGYTYIVVFKDTAFTAGNMGDGAGDYIIDRGPPSPEGNELCSFKITSTNKYGAQKRDGGGGGLGGPVSSSNCSNGFYRVIDYRQTPGATKVYDLYLDGLFEGTVSSADADYVPPTPQIGHHYRLANGGLKGYVAEVIIYNYNVNNAQMNILNSYLAAKYGLTLTANDKYDGDSPANGNYDFEVAGVGQEAPGTNLAAASSISGGLEVVQATTMGSAEYLLYGHAAGTNSLNITDVGGMSAGPDKARWERIWYFDWTHIAGSDETVDLAFDFSDGGTGGVPIAPLTNYKLLYRAGLSGAWSEVMDASSISGDRVLFTGLAWNTRGDGYYTIGTLDNLTSPLPIELLYFTAEANGNQVDLNWSTASEINNKNFTIEKSKNGIDFLGFKTVNSKAVNGNSLSKLNYNDVDPFPFEGISYYRLKQTDNDGTSSYSKIVDVNFNQSKKVDISIDPNPNKGEFTLKFNGITANHKAQIEILDAVGKKVYENSVLISEGINSFQIIPTEKLAKGFYFVSCEVNGMNYTKKLVVN